MGRVVLLLFAPLLKPALGVRTDAEAYQISGPGLLVLLAIFGGLFQGFGLSAELRAGVIERSRATPVSRLAMLLGAHCGTPSRSSPKR
jgi:ABC-2 type transport system permease protein